MAVDGDFKVAAVFFHYNAHRLKSVTVVIFVLFGGDRHARFVQLHFTRVVIFHLYRDKGIYILYGNADLPLCLVLYLCDGLHGIIYYIAEQRVQIGIAYEPQTGAIGKAGERNIVFPAQKALFGEYEVERLVAGFYGRIVYVYYVFKVFYVLFVHSALLCVFPYLMLEVVTFEVEQHYIIRGHNTKAIQCSRLPDRAQPFQHPDF